MLTNNLANADTNGYKKEGATAQSFDPILAYKIKDNSEGYRLAKRTGVHNPQPIGIQVGMYQFNNPGRGSRSAGCQSVGVEMQGLELAQTLYDQIKRNCGID